MLKLIRTDSNAFHNFKCGEIYCITPAVYNVTCCLCGIKMHLEQFPSHFQIQHLTLAEESINLDDLERGAKSKKEQESGLQDAVPVKLEDPEEDPIKQEDGQELLSSERLQKLVLETAVAEDSISNELLKRTPESVEWQSDQNKVNESEPLEAEKEKEDNGHHANDGKASDVKHNHLLFELEEEQQEQSESNDIPWTDHRLPNSESSDEEASSKEALPFPCAFCSRAYRTKHGLQKHNHSVHNPNKPPRKRKQPKAEHKCDECNAVFRSARDLRGHKWKHTGIFCDICGKPFTQTGNMIRHKIRHTGIKAHKCQECERCFFTNKELNSHMISHTGVMPVICEICGRRCRDRGVLTAHMRRHTGERPAKCEVCGKSFYSFHDLNVHAVTHSSERPFKCDICGSTFQRKKALRVHKLLHSKDRKHVCKVCGKGFAQSGGLNAHMRTHDAALSKNLGEAEPMLPVVPVPLPESGSVNVITTTTTSAGAGGAGEEEVTMVTQFLV